MRGGIGTAKEASVGGLLRIKHLLTEWRQGRYFVAEATISAVSARSAAAISARRAIAAPNSGYIVFVVRAVGVLGIGSLYTSPTLRENAG